MKLQKLGGYASIVLICALVVAIGIAALTLPRLGLSLSGTVTDPAKVMAAYEASPITFRVLQPFGILVAMVFVVVPLTLQERMRAKAPNLTRLAVIAASVASALLLANVISGTSGMLSIASTKDISAYRAFTLVQNGLGSAAGNAWGWALLLIGWAALRTNALPRILSYIIVACGVIAIIQFVAQPLPNVVSLLVGLLNAIGAVWLGVALIRKPEPSLA
jgi:hypothetical protein